MSKVKIVGSRSDELSVVVDLDEWDEDTQEALLDKDHPDHYVVMGEFLDGSLGNPYKIEVEPLELEWGEVYVLD